jgi:hypothetical protein
METPETLNLNRILKRLQPLSWRVEDVPKFVDELKQLLLVDFDQTFSVLRTHKLVSQWRSLKVFQLISTELCSWLSSASLSGKKKAQVRRHLEVCEFVQRMFNEIDTSAQELTVWSSEPALFIRAILGFVEYQAGLANEGIREFGKKFPKTASDPDKNVLELRAMHDHVRNISDAVCILLRQFALRHIEPSTGVPDNTELSVALALAHRKDFVQQFFDNYSYLQWQAKIIGNTIYFRPPHPDRILREYYSQQLVHAGDQFDSIPEIQTRFRFERDVPEEFRTSIASKSFSEFFVSPEGEQSFKKGKDVAAEVIKRVRTKILELFDESVALRTPDGSFTIQELVQAWGFLISIAYCATGWTRSKIPRSPADELHTYAPALDKDLLIGLISRELKIPKVHAGELLGQFTIHGQGDDDWDLFYRPLVLLPGGDLGIASTFIEMSRFYRNLFSIAVKDSDVDLSARGFKPLSGLCEKFSRARIKTGTNKRLRTEGRDITDVDFFFVKDRILFIAQIKVLLEPDSVYDTWKVTNKLTRAAEQLLRTMHSPISVRNELLDELQISEQERKRISHVFPFILCNIEHATGLKIKGFSVVHFGFLEMLLRGGRVGVLAVDGGSIRRVGSKPLIRGAEPSGAEIMSLIEDPRPYYSAMFRRPEIGHLNFVSGSYVIQVPGAKVPPEE